MPTEFSGKQLLASMTQLQEKAASNISDIREVLNPMLSAQGKSLDSEETFSAVLKDINKLTTVEKHINNGSLKDMTFVESGLFTNSIIPSNVVMINDTRSIFVEEGLLYILDFDIKTLKVTNKEVHKINPVWNMCDEGKQVRLVLGTGVLWVIPTHGSHIIGLRGDGIFSSGKIRYFIIPLDQDLTITDFKVCGKDIAFISNENIYYRIDDVNPGLTEWSSGSWSYWSMNRCYATCICDGNLDYVATRYGEIWKLNHDLGEFEYIIDMKNVSDYEDHYRDLIENRDEYKPILYLAKNDIQWMALEKSNILYLTICMSSEDLDSEWEPVELPSSFSVGSIVVNTRSYHDRSILFGYDDSLSTVAYSFRTTFEGIDLIELGSSDLAPQWVSVAIFNGSAVMLEMYEHVIPASKYYTDEDITNEGYTDFRYTSLTMRQASYVDYQYIFGPEFNPLFIPAFIKAEKGKTVVIDKGSTSLSFNIAFTSDQSHWKLVNLPREMAINVQDVESGNGIFVAIGLQNDSVLISKNCYKWEKIALADSSLELISMVYNRHRNRFYAVNYEGTKLVEIDPVNMTTEIKDIEGITSKTETVFVKNICSYAQNIIINAVSNSNIVSYKTLSGELDDDIMINGIERYEMKIFDSVDNYASFSSAIVNTFEVADNIYSIHRLNVPWDIDGKTDYDKSLLTGVVIAHTKKDREMSETIVGNSEFLYAVFPYDPDNAVYGMEYLNHIVIIQQQDKYFIPMNKTSAPICYHNNYNGKFFMVQVNAKCGCIGDGYLHLIQSHSCNFTRIAYIMSSDQSYSPVVTNVDLYDDKKNVRVSQYQLDNDYDNIDRNGNIEVYPVVYSDLKDSYAGSIIRSDKYIRVGKSDVGYVSEDGLHWKEGFKLPSSGWWRDICYGINIEGEKIYVAIKYISAISSELYYSNDLIVWTKASIPNLSYGWSEIIYVDGCFAVSAHYTANSKYILFSLDGKMWAQIELDHAVDKLRKYSDDNTSFIAFSSVIASGRENYFVIKNRGKEIETETVTGSTGKITNLKDIIPKIDDGTVSALPLVLDDNGTISGSWNVKNVTPRETVHSSLSSAQIFFDDNGNPIIVIFDAKYSCLYIDYFDDDNLDSYSAIKVDLPNNSIESIGHFICYSNDKLFVGLDCPVMIDLINTVPDRIDGSFMIENSKEHYQTLPFTPDHVFLFGADSDSSHDKLLIGEIHKDDILGSSSTDKSSLVFNNTEKSMKHRSDVSNVIVERGFRFVNRTNADRLVNFIAIKENRYQ